MSDLETRIKEQITKYLPQFSLARVRCELDADMKVIKIYITSNEINVFVPINTQTGEVLDKETHLTDFR